MKKSLTATVIPMLALDDLEKAKAMQVSDFKALYSRETTDEIAAKAERQAMTVASVSFMKAARGLGESVNEILLENESLQKHWAKVMADIALGKDGAGSSFERKAMQLPIIGGIFKKRVDARMATNILEVLPDLLRQQWDVTEAAAKRVKVQMVMISQSEKQAQLDLRRLSEDQIRLREEAIEERSEFDSVRASLASIETKLKRSGELDEMLTSGKQLPDGEKPLSADEYATLMNRRTEIMEKDGDQEIKLQTITQQFRATKDGYALTELQIGELNTTRKGMNAISIMLEAFLEITRPIMLRSINIMNAQTSGLRGATLLQALGQSMNETIKMCAYGMTVMTEQAMALGRMDFIEENTISEVKAIQSANDQVWNDFTRVQYDSVMERANLLLEHKAL